MLLESLILWMLIAASVVPQIDQNCRPTSPSPGSCAPCTRATLERLDIYTLPDLVFWHPQASGTCLFAPSLVNLVSSARQHEELCDVHQRLNIHDPRMNQLAYLDSMLIPWLSNAINMPLYLHVPKSITGQPQTSFFLSHSRRRGDLGRLLQFRTDPSFTLRPRQLSAACPFPVSAQPRQ